MDMLSQRYACPFLLLDDFIRLEQLHDFIDEISGIIYEENKEKYQWEFYLHKVFDRTWDEFMNGIPSDTETEMTDEEINNVVNESLSLLDLF